MTKRIITALLCFVAAIAVNAQTFHEDGYSYYFDYDHRVVVRSTVSCDSEAQDLWNGDHVRLYGGSVYIYRGNTKITYGDKIWLIHTGDYVVERGGWEYLIDSDGESISGTYSDEIPILTNAGTFRVLRGGKYYGNYIPVN